MDSQKNENLLNLALDTAEAERARSLELNVGYDDAEESWEVIVKYHGSLQGLSAWGIRVEELISGYAILTVPAVEMARLSGAEQIEYVEKPKRLFFADLQGNTASCFAPGSQTAGALTGKGVLVAVIDSGISYWNRDFRWPDGSTRIRRLWDQALNREFTEEEINAALASGSRLAALQIVPSVDISGHGTAVAGIAAGNGGELGRAYAGIAPESELLVVRLGLPRADSFPRTTELMRALTYVVNKARDFGQPLSVNLSFGNTYGAHNGSSLLERFIDNVSEIGRTVICVGSGNEGASGGHVGGSFLVWGGAGGDAGSGLRAEGSAGGYERGGFGAGKSAAGYDGGGLRAEGSTGGYAEGRVHVEGRAEDHGGGGSRAKGSAEGGGFDAGGSADGYGRSGLRARESAGGYDGGSLHIKESVDGYAGDSFQAAESEANRVTDLVNTNDRSVINQEALIEMTVGAYETGLNVQIWKEYTDRYQVTLVSPSGERFQVDTDRPGKQVYQLQQTRILLYNGEPAPYRTGQELYFDFLPAEGGRYLDQGVWSFGLRPLRIVTGNYAFYLPSGAVRSADTRFVRPTPDTTLTIPSTAARVITVGAYDPVYEAYADFSGRGYLYQDQAGSRTADVYVKPDLAAPGVGVLAPDRDGGYKAFTGTSFAAPFVAGAAALLMQWGIVLGNDPYLYGEKVKAYLRKGAKPIRGVAEYPDARVGYGALCVKDSLP